MIAVEPFSEIWYKDCFYHALFSAITLFKKSYAGMQVSDFFKFELTDNGILSYQQCEYLDIENGLKKIGIGLSIDRLDNNLIAALKILLDEGKLIILNIDRNVIKSENTEVDVTCHSILVYGYKKDDFMIMENRYVNSSLFEKKKVSQEKLESAYYSFINKLQHFKYGMYVLENLSTTCKEYDFGKIMSDNIYKNVEIREKSIAYLSKYINNISYQIKTEDKLNKYVDDIMNTFNRVIVNKTIEEFSISRLIDDDKYGILLKKILEKWQICRTLIYKYKIVNKYVEADMVKVINNLNDAIDVERELIFVIKEKRNGTED